MNRQTNDSEALARALVNEAKNCKDYRRLFEIANALDCIAEYCQAAQIRRRAMQLNDKAMVRA